METRMPVTERTALSLRLSRLTIAHDTAADAYAQLVNWPGAGKDQTDPVALATWRRRLAELYAVKDALAAQCSAAPRRLRSERSTRPTPLGVSMPSGAASQDVRGAPSWLVGPTGGRKTFA